MSLHQLKPDILKTTNHLQISWTGTEHCNFKPSESVQCLLSDL